MCCRQSSKGAQKKPAIRMARGQLLSVVVWRFEGIPQLLISCVASREVMAPAFIAHCRPALRFRRVLPLNNRLYCNEIGC